MESHNDVYATNEESMMDWESNMSQERDWKKHLVLDGISDDQGMISSLAIPQEDHMGINSLHENVALEIQMMHKPVHQLQTELNESY